MTTPGRTWFGRYELLERLGAGGMAVVYRARYPAAPGVTKSVVIKRVLGHHARDPAFTEMFLNEARISVSLNHGNVVQVFDFGEVEGEYFLAMEWVDGHPLSHVMKRARTKGLPRLPAPIAAGIAIDMCRGLHYAHLVRDEQGEPLGLVHRDISPDNVLMSFEGEVKISDFGIAKARLVGRPETEVGVVRGKFQYFSPEQAQGDALDARSDVYAVGVVLYQMLCGQLPTEGGELEVMFRTVEGRLTPAQQLNPTLDVAMLEILQRALMTSREARYRTAEALQQSLSDWLSTNAPLFPTNTRKHLMGWLFQEELAARKRVVAFPSGFQAQLEAWLTASGAGPTPLKRRAEAAPVTQELPVGGAAEVAPVTQVMAARPRPRSAAITEPVLPDSTPVQDGVALRVVRRATTLVQEMGPSMRRPRNLAVLVLLLLTALGAWGWMRHYLSPEPVWVRSTPAGATVYLNGVRVGQTPLRLDLSDEPSRRVVKVAQAGYLSWSREYQPGTSVSQDLVAELLWDSAFDREEPPETEAPPDELTEDVGEEELVPEEEDLLSEEDAASSESGVSMIQAPPARVLLRESGQSFNPTRKARELVLDPAETYTLRTTNPYGYGWSRVLDGDGRHAPSSSRVLAFIADPEVAPQRRLVQLSSETRRVTGVTHLWLFILWGRDWALTRGSRVDVEVRSALGRAGDGRPLNVAEVASELEPESRFTVHKLRPSQKYAVEIRVPKGRPISPVIMLAVPAAPHVLRVTGQPAQERLHVLTPGRHVVSGASELWFSLPRWAGDEELEVEVEVKASP
ncbi:protein kinase [Myxococcus sp. K38C18041901]|uniref:serine/threonine protein kinase n=1 Tax=Myxococcus guangdongensis TaxID=2906760 RepID=UPI0020A70592|nr:serine/threonine-protein kinase [Myxococcus guangdongensis]MCP3065213.1 protein kinase [Myxococcus guangdongensis]